MVLGCFICRQPLIKHNKKRGPTKSKPNLSKNPGKGKGQGPNDGMICKTGPGGKPVPAAAARASQSQASLCQPIATRCGHIFHRGCLKNHIAKTPVRFGGKIECPVCLKVMSFSQCFNVHLDAMPPGKPVPNCMFQQLDEINRENRRIQLEIASAKNFFKELGSFDNEIQTQIRRLSQEITMKSNEIKQFDEYCKRTGGLPEVNRRLKDPTSNAKLRALEAENRLLKKLTGEQNPTELAQLYGKNTRAKALSNDSDFLNESFPVDSEYFEPKTAETENNEVYYSYYHGLSKPMFTNSIVKNASKQEPYIVEISTAESLEYLSKFPSYLNSYRSGVSDSEDSYNFLGTD